MKAEIITIGDEILLGQIVDTNSAFIANELFQNNVSVHTISSIADTREALLEALKRASMRSDLVIITGGLGPTNDDVTKKTAAEFFHVDLIRSPEVFQHVENIFLKRKNQPMLFVNLAQADILENSEVLFNDVGTAPGMWVSHNGVNYAFLPGVPFEMRFLIKERVIPKIREMGSYVSLSNRYILTVGIGESFLAKSIENIENNLPEYMQLAYLPAINQVLLRLSARGENKEDTIAALEKVEAEIVKRVEKHVVAQKDISIESVILNICLERGKTIVTAESCTGGSIASRLTSVPGSSAVFLGSVVAYDNAVKTSFLGVPVEHIKKYGAVSDEVVTAMAVGGRSRMNADYCLATSGIAGPGGGSQEKPVGTVWVALAGPNGTKSKVFHFHNDRLINIERSVQQAFYMLWKELVGQSHG